MDHYEAVTRKILALASLLDNRVPECEDGIVQAWADCFRGEDVFETEALEAVRRHYKKPNPFPIRPGDILAQIKQMPVNSSPERIMAFIAKYIDYPYSPAIEMLTGMRFVPTYPTPPGIHGDAAKEREFHKQELRDWIRTNGQALVQAALDNPKPLLALER